MGQIKEIFEGWINDLFKNEEVEKLAKKRLKICFECPIRTDNKCDKSKGGCGCPLKKKARSPSSKCPKNYW